MRITEGIIKGSQRRLENKTQDTTVSKKRPGKI
jgi:hypothetical protein